MHDSESTNYWQHKGDRRNAHRIAAALLLLALANAAALWALVR